MIGKKCLRSTHVFNRTNLQSKKFNQNQFSSKTNKLLTKNFQIFTVNHPLFVPLYALRSPKTIQLCVREITLLWTNTLIAWATMRQFWFQFTLQRNKCLFIRFVFHFSNTNIINAFERKTSSSFLIEYGKGWLYKI